MDDMTEQQITDRERLRCVRLCEMWIASFKDRDIKYVSARDYAVDAINDIIDLITDGQDVGQSMPVGTILQS